MVAHILLIETDIPVDVIPTGRSDEGFQVEKTRYTFVFLKRYT